MYTGFLVDDVVGAFFSSSESLDERLLLLGDRLPDRLSSLSLPESSEYMSDAFSLIDDLPPTPSISSLSSSCSFSACRLASSSSVEETGEYFISNH